MRSRQPRRRVGLAWCGPGLFLSFASCALAALGCDGESALVGGSGGAAAASGGASGGTAAASGGASGGSAGQAGSAGAIVVDTPSGEVATESLDGHCDLLEAIAAANTDQPVHECPAGNGADRIVLASGAVYPVPRTLTIDAALTLGVAGANGRATISAAPGFADRPDDRGSGCLLHAKAAGAKVKVEDVVLTQAPGLAVSGACVTSGWLEVRRARVTGFARGGAGVYCLPELGCDHDGAGDTSNLSVLNTLVDGNRSPASGGGIFSEGDGATLYVGSSAVVDNVSESSGGGVYFGGGWNTQKIATSTISGNRAASGGGVYARFTACSATYLFITNSTIAYNTATSRGGGIDFDGQIECYAQDVSVLSSIVANNAAEETDEDDIDADWKGGMFECDLHSLLHVAPGLPEPQVGDGSCRFDVSDALLGPLMPMGGTSNLPLHPLLHGSPAIDAARDSSAQDQQRDPWVAISDDPPPPPDWMMFERVVDGDGDGVKVRDLGAFEANDVWQTELLQLQSTGPGSHAVVTTPDGYARGAGTSYAATSASGEFVTYVVPIAEAGSYQFSLGFRRADDAGQLQATVADDPTGPWLELGAALDTYAASSQFDEIPLAKLDVEAAGQKLVRFTVSGKHAESRSFHLYLDYLRVQRDK